MLPALRTGFHHRSLAEEVVLTGCRERGVGVGRPDEALLKRVHADFRLKLHTALHRRAGIVAWQHVVGLCRRAGEVGRAPSLVVR